MRYAKFLNFKLLQFPFIYLGLPVGVNLRRVTIWNPIVEKYEKRLSRWNDRVLSFAGRVFLINFILSSFLWGKKIEYIQTNFLWGGAVGKKKVCWVRWESICQPKKLGGLVIKNLELFNFALLAKWKWSLFDGVEGGLWKHILISKYGGWKRLSKGREGARKSSYSWKDLCKVCGGRKCVKMVW